MNTREALYTLFIPKLRVPVYTHQEKDTTNQSIADIIDKRKGSRSVLARVSKMTANKYLAPFWLPYFLSRHSILSIVRAHDHPPKNKRIKDLSMGLPKKPQNSSPKMSSGSRWAVYATLVVFVALICNFLDTIKVMLVIICISRISSSDHNLITSLGTLVHFRPHRASCSRSRSHRAT